MSAPDPLVTFLRQHRPLVPPPSPYLEQRILNQIHTHPLPAPPRLFRRRWRWALGLVVPLVWLVSTVRPPLVPPLVPLVAGEPGDDLSAFLLSQGDVVLEEPLWSEYFGDY
ncbi:MAG: hypothetical protein OHK0012_03800 [Synechococcales cyanobacterium]